MTACKMRLSISEISSCVSFVCFDVQFRSIVCFFKSLKDVPGEIKSF